VIVSDLDEYTSFVYRACAEPMVSFMVPLHRRSIVKALLCKIVAKLPNLQARLIELCNIESMHDNSNIC
jgi:hypothetical protein